MCQALPAGVTPKMVGMTNVGPLAPPATRPLLLGLQQQGQTCCLLSYSLSLGPLCTFSLCRLKGHVS